MTKSSYKRLIPGCKISFPVLFSFFLYYSWLARYEIFTDDIFHSRDDPFQISECRRYSPKFCSDGFEGKSVLSFISCKTGTVHPISLKFGRGHLIALLSWTKLASIPSSWTHYFLTRRLLLCMLWLIMFGTEQLLFTLEFLLVKDKCRHICRIHVTFPVRVHAYSHPYSKVLQRLYAALYSSNSY